MTAGNSKFFLLVIGWYQAWHTLYNSNGNRPLVCSGALSAFIIAYCEGCGVRRCASGRLLQRPLQINPDFQADAFGGELNVKVLIGFIKSGAGAHAHSEGHRRGDEAKVRVSFDAQRLGGAVLRFVELKQINGVIGGAGLGGDLPADDVGIVIMGGFKRQTLNGGGGQPA